MNPTSLSVLICYRNFSARNANQYSHIGLGNNAIHSAKVLKQHGIHARVAATWAAKDIETALKADPSTTHCIVEAAFIDAPSMQALVRSFPRVEFAVRNHSQIAFLQVEPGAIKLFRDYCVLEESELNLRFCSNSRRFAEFWQDAYKQQCLFLPNLYCAERAGQNTAARDSHLIRISSFGATRIMKNHTTAAAAALLIARRLGVDLEFYVSNGREENGKTVLAALRAMFDGLRFARLVENPWQAWAEFRHAAGHMDLALQVSMSETFNITSADAMADGVPVVGSECIEWLPRGWQAPIDDAMEIARTGAGVIQDPRAGSEACAALLNYCAGAFGPWAAWLVATV